ncbi:MAG: hypothetical protein LBD06_13485 [Candidatus Accumulibacter sp.]|nr:hypothetical protein [Accumulibacter sp.]
MGLSIPGAIRLLMPRIADEHRCFRCKGARRRHEEGQKTDEFERFAPSEDGKSSARFLCLLSSVFCSLSSVFCPLSSVPCPLD